MNFHYLCVANIVKQIIRMNLKHFLLVFFVTVFADATAVAQSLSPSTRTHWEKGTLVIDSPARPAGQQHVLGLSVPKMECVRVGFVGLGMRGPGAVERFTHIPGVRIVALCDYEKPGRNHSVQG